MVTTARENEGTMDKLVQTARDVIREVVRESAEAELKLIDQRGSPLGRNRHCAAVKRRVFEGKPGAWVVGRRCLLSAEALREELDDLGRRGTVARENRPDRPSPRAAREKLEQRLRLIRSRGQ
jgi:hypothetical protein